MFCAKAITMVSCPLCLETSPTQLSLIEGKLYFHCSTCDLRFLAPTHHLDHAEERERYLLHNQEMKDPGYEKFVGPLIDELHKHIDKPSVGLDYGSGARPLLAHLLREHGHTVHLYDPFFAPDVGALSERYDFVVSCEVVEHFADPAKEFRKLRSLLKEGGTLLIMTMLFHPEICFEEWFYRRDPTHISFYSEQTFNWIKNRFEFAKITPISDRLIFLQS